MTRLLQWIVVTVTACAYTAAHAVQSESRVPSPAAKVSRQLVEQKEAFVIRVLSDSPAVKRIEASTNAEARKYLVDARESHAKAVVSMRNNDINGADRQLNDATWLIGKARQIVPDPLARNVEQRMRYAQILESVESLRISYRRHLQRVKGRSPGMVANDAQLGKVAQLVNTAKSLANSGQLVQANKMLGKAERALMAGLTQVLGTKTIMYAQRFGTLAEEYDYELERNRSYADLIPIALAEFKPGSEVVREVRHFVDANRQRREQAQQLAAKKDHRAALTALRGGTAHLQSALTAAGLRVPPDPQTR
jgi:hypothetical protein